MGDYGDQLRIGKGDDVQVQGQGVHPHTLNLHILDLHILARVYTRTPRAPSWQ